ncbi:MAG: hypothetical protein WAV63_00460, partial [Trichococcus flocculiformis]
LDLKSPTFGGRYITRWFFVTCKMMSLIKKLFYHIKKQKETFIKQKQKNKTKKRTKRLILCLVLFIMRA